MGESQVAVQRTKTNSLPLLERWPTVTERFTGAGAAGASAASLAARLARFCWWRFPCTIEEGEEVRGTQVGGERAAGGGKRAMVQGRFLALACVWAR